MLIEVRKAGFVNKGAHLMLLSIKQAIETQYADASITIAPSRNSATQPVKKIRENGFLIKASAWRLGVQWGDLAGLLPNSLRSRMRLVLDKEVDVVLDASGFLYGSPWGRRALLELRASAERWRRSGTGLIFLPQAFGRFDTKIERESIFRVADTADLIFARDRQSLANIQEVLGTRDNVVLGTDFTVVTEPILPNDRDRLSKTVAFIPNARMLDQTSADVRNAYLPFLKKCMRQLSQSGLNVALVIHEQQSDARLAEALMIDESSCSIIREDDPLKIKGLLGACRGVIGSRYHGLIGGLSQGVPAFGTSWNHKYRSLYEEYNFPEGLVVDLSETEARRICQALLDDGWNTSIRTTLQLAGKEKEAVIKSMWQQVFSVAAQYRHRGIR